MFESLTKNRTQNRLKYMDSLSPSEREGYDKVETYIAALGKVAEKRNIAIGFSVNSLHLSYVDFALLMEKSSEATKEEVSSRQSKDVLTFVEGGFFNKLGNKEIQIYPRLFYTLHPELIESNPDKERILQNAEIILGKFPRI